MCGIAGIFDPPTPPSRAAVERMCASMRHRGPDDEGFFESSGVMLGMRRLSIIDVAGGHQPIANEDGSIVIILNGEIYNFIELRAELEKRGHRFRTRSDAEVVLHLYEERGVGCLDALNGMFAFCLWDSRRREGLLARDRLGVKPIYYTLTGGRLSFASELKALIAGCGSFPFDHAAIDEYLRYLFIPAPRTPFQGVRKLMPASYIRFGPASVDPPVEYWSVPVQGSRARSPQTLEDEFFDMLSHAVERQLRSDVPVGVFLSGGIDSSLITAMAARKTDQRVLSFSVEYPNNPFDETPYAALAARYFGCDHRTVKVGAEEAWALLPEAVWHMDEPHADSAAVATLAVSRLAAEHVKVVLSGTGGDELFGGYKWHLPPSRSLRSMHALPDFIVGLVARTITAAGFATTGHALEWVRTPADAFLWPHYQFKPGQLHGFFAASAAAVDGDGDLRRRFASLRGDGLNRLLEFDLGFYLTDDLLLLLDKMTMAASIEGRVPLLDHELVEWAFAIPGDMKIERGVRKALLKQWLRGLLPPELLQRPKWGFGAPVRFWMDRLDREAFRLIDQRPATREDFYWGTRGGALAARLRQLTAQQRYGLLVLEIWCRQFLENESAASLAATRDVA